jgi:6-phosphogluconolactonase
LSGRHGMRLAITPTNLVKHHCSLPDQQHFAVMHQPPADPVVYSMETVDDVVSALASFVTKAQKEAIEKKGRFTIALSGGSLPKMLRGLVNVPSIQWDKW